MAEPITMISPGRGDIPPADRRTLVAFSLASAFRAILSREWSVFLDVRGHERGRGAIPDLLLSHRSTWLVPIVVEAGLISLHGGETSRQWVLADRGGSLILSPDPGRRLHAVLAQWRTSAVPLSAVVPVLAFPGTAALALPNDYRQPASDFPSPLLLLAPDMEDYPHGLARWVQGLVERSARPIPGSLAGTPSLHSCILSRLASAVRLSPQSPERIGHLLRGPTGPDAVSPPVLRPAKIGQDAAEQGGTQEGGTLPNHWATPTPSAVPPPSALPLRPAGVGVRPARASPGPGPSHRPTDGLGNLLRHQYPGTFGSLAPPFRLPVPEPAGLADRIFPDAAVTDRRLQRLPAAIRDHLDWIHEVLSKALRDGALPLILETAHATASARQMAGNHSPEWIELDLGLSLIRRVLRRRGVPSGLAGGPEIDHERRLLERLIAQLSLDLVNHRAVGELFAELERTSCLAPDDPGLLSKAHFRRGGDPERVRQSCRLWLAALSGYRPVRGHLDRLEPPVPKQETL